MKRKIIVNALIFFTLSLSAQEVVSSQGGSYSNANMVLDYTIGEVIIKTGTDGVNFITQGFHQPNIVIIGIQEYLINYEVQVFPNPSSEIIYIEAPLYKGVVYRLLDMQGKVLSEGRLSSNLTSVQVGQLAAGSYMLLLNKQEQKLKTIKLLKNK